VSTSWSTNRFCFRKSSSNFYTQPINTTTGNHKNVHLHTARRVAYSVHIQPIANVMIVKVLAILHKRHWQVSNSNNTYTKLYNSIVCCVVFSQQTHRHIDTPWQVCLCLVSTNQGVFKHSDSPKKAVSPGWWPNDVWYAYGQWPIWFFPVINKHGKW